MCLIWSLKLLRSISSNVLNDIMYMKLFCLKNDCDKYMVSKFVFTFEFVVYISIFVSLHINLFFLLLSVLNQSFVISLRFSAIKSFTVLSEFLFAMMIEFVNQLEFCCL